jgi:potassium efflux system protein
VELDTNERLLLAEVDRFSGFLKERVLWIPSAQPISLSDFPRAAEALRWLVNPSAWADLVSALWKDAVRNPGLTIPVLLLAIAMQNYRRRLKERLKENGARRLSGLPATFTNTLRALGMTIALALPVPAFMWYVGWRLGVAPSTTDLAPALGQALRRAAQVLSSFELLRVSLLSNGLTEAHLGWSAQALAVMRRNMRWALPTLITAALIRLTLENQAAEARRDSLGRIAFVAGMMVLAVFNARVLHPRRGAVAEWLAARRGSFSERLSPVTYWMLVGSPVGFALLSLLGYSYTAFRLTLLFVTSLWLILAVMLGGSLLNLWFQIARRNLALREARKKAESRAEAAEQNSLPEAAPVTQVDEGPDMGAMAAQLNRLVGGLVWTVLFVGLWLVWSSVLPAFEILRSVEFWRHTVKVAEMIAQPDGTSRLQVVDKVEAVTLMNLLIAILLGVFTFAAARNVPVVLEVSFLRRLNFDSGLRYAITSVSRYVIIILGIFAVFSCMGVGWSNVQWLAAAASVGLGFGLQEILANFVSGIIILFERPIRVGDLVTIGKTTGTVTQVRIRATTIRDWDGRDLLVPNKQIITNEVVNWTLVDTLSRITFSVTADNGSDPDRVRELLLEMARSHPLVLSDPAPFALFEGFGDSGLNFKLFTFVHKLSDRGQVTNDLNARIQEVFTREGIGIAYPVRDMILAYPPAAKTDEKA